MKNWKDRLTILQEDITALVDVDAIVNAANEQLLPGGGVCGAIHAAAGPRLASLCEDIGHCATGAAVATPAFDLPCRYVIHAVGPIWGAGSGNLEDSLLASCYLQSLRIADDLGCESVAFPSISTGAYGYPIEEASRIALKTIASFLSATTSLKEVVFVLFDSRTFDAYASALGEIKE